MHITTAPHPTEWLKQERAHAQWLLRTTYAEAYDKHRKTWDIDRHADDPDFQEELREEREGLRLLKEFWGQNHDSDNPVLPNKEDLRLMVIGSESL